jgi:ankyrin repeat protein
MNRGGEPSDAIATMHEKIPPIRKKIDRNSNIWSRHTQSTLLRGKELQKTRERIQVANEEENERSLSTSTTRRTYGVHVTDKKSKKKRERLRSRPVQKINGLPTVMMRQTQSTIFRDKELQRNREHVQATTRRTYGLPVTDKVSKKKRERLRLRPVQKINGLPTVMMRQTQSTIFRDKELQRNREHVQATKEKASQLRTSFPQRMCRHAMPEKKMKERRKKVQLPVHEEKDVGWQNTTSFDCENGFDRNRPKATRKKQNSNVGQPTKVATKSSAPKSMDFNRKNGSKWEVDIGKQTSTQNGLWRKPNEKAVKDIYEHEVGMCANSVPKYVSDDDIMSVSDISQSAKKELSRHSTIAAQIESCSWQDLYHNLNLLGHTPEEILEALHIGTWKPPPALSIKLLDLISPSELEILLRVDEDGNTPLHLCCGNLSPPPTGHEEMQTDVDCSVLTALLERTPESLGKQNVEGDTPLHLFLTSPLVSACVDKQSYDFQKDAIAAFRIIEKRMPTRDCFLIQDSLGASPLHNAIANNVGEPILLSLIEAEPKACKVEDKAGLVPLHYVAAFLETSPLVVKKMIEEYTYSVCHKSLDGDTPLHILIRNSSDDNQSNRELILDDNSRLVLNLLLGNLSSSSNRNGSDKDFNGQYCPLLIENREKVSTK